MRIKPEKRSAISLAVKEHIRGELIEDILNALGIDFFSGNNSEGLKKLAETLQVTEEEAFFILELGKLGKDSDQSSELVQSYLEMKPNHREVVRLIYKIASTC